jgi:hypothetical protein
LQRLPPHRIQRAHELDEVDLQEHPTPAGLRSGEEAALRTRPDFLRVHVQEASGFFESESPQGVSTQAEPVDRLCLGEHQTTLCGSGRLGSSCHVWRHLAPAAQLKASLVSLEFQRKSYFALRSRMLSD